MADAGALLILEGTKHIVKTRHRKDKLGVARDIGVGEVETVRNTVPQLGYSRGIRVADRQARIRPQF